MVTSWHIVGDSHVSSFRHAGDIGLITRPCIYTEIGGATAVGLRNPNTSRTNAIEHYKEALLPFQSGISPVIHLGEVDCGYLIWYRAKKFNEPIAIQMTQSQQAYFDFVDTLMDAGYREVVITGASLPTIRDGTDWGEIQNLRREVTASLLERTNLTIEYNKMLKEGAGVRDLKFIDIASELINNNTGVIDDFYRHPDPANHHLHPERTGHLWAAELNAIAVGG